MTLHTHSMTGPRRARLALPVLLAASAALLGAAPALGAEDFPIPLMMKDLPPTRGSWQMELLESSRQDEMKNMLGGHVKLCQTAAQSLRHEHQHADKAAEPNCTTRMLENSLSRAVMETTCKGTPPRVSKVTITRDGAHSYVITEDEGSAANARHEKIRMSYLGPCSETDATMTLDKSSPACQQMRAHLAEMDPQKSCSHATGDKQAQCIERMQRVREQMAKTCSE
jgi:hypothetical protein